MSVHLEGGEYMQGLSIICKAVELHPSRLPGWSITSGEMWVWFESLRSSWTCSVILIRQFELCEASGRQTQFKPTLLCRVPCDRVTFDLRRLDQSTPNPVHSQDITFRTRAGDPG
ncbi:unnamed protein product [Rhizoctonia solani]|uniref:Uncharacterized protein n=1 Tax=Rhizoctonia solani TaxID=456999 RepID=A0A8H3GML6_9AGAM|nr:unnamed protein product [Rhizoctonia solani]